MGISEGAGASHQVVYLYGYPVVRVEDNPNILTKTIINSHGD